MRKRILHNFHVHIDDRGYAGLAKEVTPPTITSKVLEIFAGGMAAPVDVPMGSFEKLEAEVVLLGQSPEVLKRMGVVQGSEVPLTVRGAMSDGDGSQSNITLSMRGYITEISRGTWAAGEETPLTVKMAVHYYKEVQAGEEILEIDPVNMVLKVGGVDKLADMRTALGL